MNRLQWKHVQKASVVFFWVRLSCLIMRTWALTFSTTTFVCCVFEFSGGKGLWQRGKGRLWKWQRRLVRTRRGHDIITSYSAQRQLQDPQRAWCIYGCRPCQMTVTSPWQLILFHGALLLHHRPTHTQTTTPTTAPPLESSSLYLNSWSFCRNWAAY